MLQNDLDLIVKASTGRAAWQHGPLEEVRQVNNVERVVWNNIPAGDVTFTFRAFHIRI